MGAHDKMAELGSGATGTVLLPPITLDESAADWLSVPGLRGMTIAGHAGRPLPAGGRFTLEDLADDVADRLVGPVDIVGCSLGGMVALHLALRHPEKVNSLLLAFTTARTPTEILRERADWTVSAALEVVVEGNMRRWFTESALAKVPLQPPVAYARACLQRADPARVADLWRAMSEHDVLADLGHVQVPTTCVAGTLDVATSMSAMIELSEGIPGSALVTMDAPHFGFLEHPAKFSALVRSHLDRVKSRARNKTP